MSNRSEAVIPISVSGPADAEPPQVQVPHRTEYRVGSPINRDYTSSDEARLVIQSAEALFKNPASKSIVEPETPALARLAVEHLAALFAEAPGVFIEALEGARAGAEVLSSDRLQGLAEIVQNADDTGATQLRFQLEPEELRVTHNGRPVNLRDVLALATPWLTTKRNDPRATGRFGIGLMTLQALSPILEVYSGPYAIRLGSPALSWIEATSPISDQSQANTTLLRIPLAPGVLDADEFARWFDDWDDAALLFCSTVKEVEVCLGAQRVRMLRLKWSNAKAEVAMVGGDLCAVRRRHARAQDGRCWVVHTAQTAPPAGVERTRKARAEKVPVGVALPLFLHERGTLYAGLPIAATRLSARLHGQFDPTAGRQALAATSWNTALYPLVADLWQSAVVRLFADSPATAWGVIPLAGDTDGASAAELEGMVLDRARSELPTLIRIDVGGEVLPLTNLAFEVQVLTDVITGAEVARLADLPAALPAAVRDKEGRWRNVLNDWRTAGAPLPPSVDVEDALDLFMDLERDPEAVVALAAAAVRDGLERRLAAFPAIALSDGSRSQPPAQTDPWILVTMPGGLGDELGITRALHPAQLAGSTPAKVVLDWLRRTNAVAEGLDAYAILSRLARAGDGGQRLPNALSDRQIAALRDAFDVLSAEQRSRVGPGVGRAIQLRAYHFDQRGRRQETVASPANAYIPQQIEKDREGFGIAAGNAPGLVWIHGRYARVLKSSVGRSGLGPIRFLRLLGAETVPRLAPHPQLEKRYAIERERGLPVDLADGPAPRCEAMEALGATYTLEDRHSPDLLAVLLAIAQDRKARRRRNRAAAMLGALGRAWERLADDASVTAALDSYGWHRKGAVRAFWVWQAATIAWLDDSRGVPTPPAALRRRTPGTLAAHGPDASGYLHRDLQEHRVDVLAAIGVAGNPDTGTLVARLRVLRTASTPAESVAIEAAALYRAVADRLGDGTHLPGDLSPAKLLSEFSVPPGLILTNRGWKRPAEVLTGDPIFGDRRAFVPGVQGTKRLWTMLKLRPPSLSDCVAVLDEMGQARRPPVPEDFVVILESLRYLSTHIGEVTQGGAIERQLAKLPVWTSKGWKTRRPVYVVGDLPLADGLKDLVPVWIPGGEVAQFKALLVPLRLTDVVSSSASVVEAEQAEIDEDATETLRNATGLLKEDLIRNEPAAAGHMRTEWDRLACLEVRVSPTLRVHVDGVGSKEGLVVPVSAKVDLEAGVLFLRDPDLLARVDGGGRAMAGLFGTNPRRLAQAWLAACQEAQVGREAVQLRLADERAAAEQREIAARLAEFRGRTGQAHDKRQVGSARPTVSNTPAPASGTSTIAQPPHTHTHSSQRTLIDPAKYRLTDSRGRLENTTGPTVKKPGKDGPAADRPLPAPRPGGASPRPGTPPAPYARTDSERVGLNLLRKVLASDEEEVIDFRGQQRIGADAMDLDDQYYELKVYAGQEPDQITLEGSQIQRALTSEFFLVIVSDIEGENARPKVRIIVDPLAQLKVAEKSSVPFTGVKATQSLVYDFARDDGPST